MKNTYTSPLKSNPIQLLKMSFQKNPMKIPYRMLGRLIIIDLKSKTTLFVSQKIRTKYCHRFSIALDKPGKVMCISTFWDLPVMEKTKNTLSSQILFHEKVK